MLRSIITIAKKCFSIAGRTCFSFDLKQEFKLEKSVSKELGDWDGVLLTAFLKDRSQPRLQAYFLLCLWGRESWGPLFLKGGGVAEAESDLRTGPEPRCSGTNRSPGQWGQG